MTNVPLLRRIGQHQASHQTNILPEFRVRCELGDCLQFVDRCFNESIFFRYQTVLKPQKIAHEKKLQEELLAEGSYQKS